MSSPKRSFSKTARKGNRARANESCYKTRGEPLKCRTGARSPGRRLRGLGPGILVANPQMIRDAQLMASGGDPIPDSPGRVMARASEPYPSVRLGRSEQPTIHRSPSTIRRNGGNRSLPGARKVMF